VTKYRQHVDGFKKELQVAYAVATTAIHVGLVKEILSIGNDLTRQHKYLE